jgi:NADH:ubiquinone oxidoreductase subunit C
MTNDELKISITALLPAAVFEEGGEWVNVQVEPLAWKSFATQLQQAPELCFDFLFCVTGVDWKTHLSLVYHFRSTQYGHVLVVKVKLDRTHPAIETVSDLWRTAEMNEREAYEMFGIQFLHHPDLRLLILPDGWEGRNPMRKDFEDPVNMIKL